MAVDAESRRKVAVAERLRSGLDSGDAAQVGRNAFDLGSILQFIVAVLVATGLIAVLGPVFGKV